jgi:hypothetical protein
VKAQIIQFTIRALVRRAKNFLVLLAHRTAFSSGPKFSENDDAVTFEPDPSQIRLKMGGVVHHPG